MLLFNGFTNVSDLAEPIVFTIEAPGLTRLLKYGNLRVFYKSVFGPALPTGPTRAGWARVETEVVAGGVGGEVGVPGALAAGLRREPKEKPAGRPPSQSSQSTGQGPNSEVNKATAIGP